MHRPAKIDPAKKGPAKVGAAKFVVALLSAAALLATAACSAQQPAAENKTLKIVYQKTDSFSALDTLFKDAKKVFSSEELEQLGKRLEQRKADVMKELKRPRAAAW